MALSASDERFLHAALDEARATAAFASPNPAVGCVLVRHGNVLGRGGHRYDTFDHAEIVALKDAAASGHNVTGATAYITLEPCSHHGRTGPCADALIAAGIARCVVATVDPNPQVSGRGVRKLIDAGLEVELADKVSALQQTGGSELQQAARRLNDAFAFSIQHGRPFVTLKAAISTDGGLAPPPGTRAPRQPVWLTGEAARADVQRLRHASDALITGIGTVLADNPALTDRTGLPRRRPLLRAVADSKLRTPPDAALLQQTPPAVLLLTTLPAHDTAAAPLLQRGAEIESLPCLAPARMLAPERMLAALAARGCRSVLLEAGSHMNASFLEAGLVDRVVLYVAACELGADAVPFSTGGPSPFELLGRLSAVKRTTLPHDGREDDICFTGYLHDPWSGLSQDATLAGARMERDGAA